MSSAGHSLIDRVDVAPDECVVEVGSDRGEGSGALRKFCADRGWQFVSVDVRPGAGDVCATGEEWLESRSPRNLRVRFAYLDNFDWPYDEMDPARLGTVVAQYAARGVRLTKTGSMAAHLRQMIALHRLTPAGAWVVIDDTWVGNGRWHGKGTWAVAWARENGWRVADRRGIRWDGYVALAKVA